MGALACVNHIKQVVPRAGLEPALLAEPDFESGASTNFTTRAFSVKTESIAQARHRFSEKRVFGGQFRLAGPLCQR